jgi:nitrous oxidase accessory protein NosD
VEWALNAIVKKIILLLVLSLLPLASAQAVTYRVIGEDSQWQGIIELSQPVLVAAGAELSITPGTRIRIATNEVVIRVEGSLQAVGNAAQPIQFETPKGWLGIELYQSEKLNRFEYVEIKAAEVGLTSSLSRFEMKQCRFRDCVTAIKLHRQTNPIIQQCEFSNNQLAIDIGTRSQVLLNGNRFVANTTAVMASHNSSGTLSGNLFADNQQGVHLQHLFPGAISGNRFEKNASAVLCDQTMASPLIVDNRFVENQQGVVCLLASKPQLKKNLFLKNDVALVNNQLGSPQVEQNVFQANTLAIKNERRSAPLIKRNRFEQNELALLCDYLSYPTVKQNNFIANALAVKLGDHQSSAMEQQGSGAGQAQKILAESGKPGKMAIFIPAAGVVDVSNNWWGKALTEASPDIFFARRQEKWVLDDTTGERYLRDQISFNPWLQQPVADAGIAINE